MHREPERAVAIPQGETLMGGMLRYPDEAKFLEMLAKSNAKLHEPRVVRPLEGVAERVATPEGKNKVKADLKTADQEGSELEIMMAAQIAQCGTLPAPVREYPFLRGSRHKLDFAWPEHRLQGRQIGLEVQGMAHRTRERFKGDMVKRAQSLLQGWVVLEVGGDQIRDGTAIAWLQELFSQVAP